MISRTCRVVSTAALIAGFILFVPANGYSLWVHLNDGQRGEAMYYGARSVQSDANDFYKEWTVDKGVGGVAILNSEFLTLASAARDASIAGEEMDADQIDDALAKTSGKLVFTVYLYGKTEDFAKDYVAKIRSGGKVYPASYWEEGENSPSESHPGYIAQELFYYFPIGDISPEKPITLEIGEPKQKEKAIFDFDLKKIK